MKQSRSRHYRFQLSRRHSLIVTVRRFYTSKSRRSRRYRQLVIDLDLGPFKEIAFRWQRQRLVTAAAGGFWHWRISAASVLISAGLGGTGYFGTQLVAAHALEPAQTFSSLPASRSLASQALPFSVPTRLRIPSIGVDVSLLSVGRDSNGSIALPPLFDWKAGWYHDSPAPGQVGPAVIVGHVDTYKGISVFWRLRDIKRGDKVYITRADGRTAVFKVTTLEQYDQNDFPTARVYGNINYPGLRLITCGGRFDETSGSYTQNTVVSGFLAT